MFLLAHLGGLPKTGNLTARPDYAAVAAELQRVFEHEMADKALPALSMALVDGQEIVWAQGIGEIEGRRSIGDGGVIYGVATQLSALHALIKWFFSYPCRLCQLLRDAMAAPGFKVYEFQWWHFDYKDWRKYPMHNTPFVVAPSGAQN